MKRLCLLGLALVLLLLSACGRAVPEATEPESTVTTTTEIETTSEEQTTEEAQTTYVHALSDTVKVYMKKSGLYGSWEIWMRDETTGNDTLLLGFKEEDDLIPWLIDTIDDRYFVFVWAVMDSDGASWPLLYDMQTKRQIEIQYPDGGGNYVQTVNGNMYFVYASGGLGPSGGVGLNVLRADLLALEKGEYVVARDIMKGVSEYDALPKIMADYNAQYALSPNAKYFALCLEGNSTLYVFNIEQRKLELSMESMPTIKKLVFTDARTLTWIKEDDLTGEITLP